MYFFRTCKYFGPNQKPQSCLYIEITCSQKLSQPIFLKLQWFHRKRKITSSVRHYVRSASKRYSFWWSYRKNQSKLEVFFKDIIEHNCYKISLVNIWHLLICVYFWKPVLISILIIYLSSFNFIIPPANFFYIFPCFFSYEWLWLSILKFWSRIISRLRSNQIILYNLNRYLYIQIFYSPSSWL